MSNDVDVIAPAPLLLMGADGALLTAPPPSLSSTLSWPGDSVVITMDNSAPAPTLSSEVLSGEVHTVEVSAAVPILVATLSSPVIIGIAGSVPAPILTAAGHSGSVATALLTAVAPTMLAAGYAAYTLTFAGTAPAPRLSATLSAAVASAYRTFALNTRKLALSEYGPEWVMNSYCVFQGKVLGCTSSGIVELGTQSLDNATAIAATVTTGKDSFGSSVLKRVPRIYVGHTAAGDLRFSAITTEGGTRQYALNWNSATGVQMRRVPVGKGPKSRFWQFSVSNVDGADFSLADILAYPTALRRRVQ